MAISVHSVRPQDCVDTEGTTVVQMKEHFKKVQTAITGTKIITRISKFYEMAAKLKTETLASNQHVRN